MKYSYILLLFFSIPCFLIAQIEQTPRPCANTEGRSDWLKAYQKNPNHYEKGADSTILYVPLSLHNVGTDVGSGYFKNRSLVDALCTLNKDFEQANIQFFVEGPIRTIDNTSYNIHETVLDGAEMMFAENIPNTLNCYIVADPAGACGYNLPYAGIALKKSCADPNDHTWAHEVGHAFKLPHPFLGWEGGVSYDDSIEHDYNDAAPTKVLIDYTYFKDTLIMDTLIIDTVWVELAERSNCHFAADGFCDTAADYLHNRWQCNANGESTRQQTDPTGTRFVSDASLIMSYSSDDCATRFSEEQIAAMRANLFDEKPELLYNQTPLVAIEESPITVFSPFEGEITPAESTYFEWKGVPNATHYVFELSRIAAFSVLHLDTIVEGTSLEVTDLLNEKNYYWRIRPFNTHYFCTSLSERFAFKTGTVSSTQELDALEVQIYPSLLQSDGILTIAFNDETTQARQATIYNINGESVQTQRFVCKNQFQMPLNNLEKGIYFVQLQSEKGSRTERVVVY